MMHGQRNIKLLTNLLNKDQQDAPLFRNLFE